MIKKKLDIASAYYAAMGKKDIAEAQKYLHPDIHLISPLAELRGKNIVIEAIKGFMASFKTIHIRTKLSNEDAVMLVIDVDYPSPIGLLRTASLLTIHDELITRIELFHDTKNFKMNDNGIRA